MFNRRCKKNTPAGRIRWVFPQWGAPPDASGGYFHSGELRRTLPVCIPTVGHSAGRFRWVFPQRDTPPDASGRYSHSVAPHGIICVLFSHHAKARGTLYFPSVQRFPRKGGLAGGFLFVGCFHFVTKRSCQRQE
jgi:hypothetical protein